MFKTVVIDPRKVLTTVDLALVQWYEARTIVTGMNRGAPVPLDETGLTTYHLSDGYDVVRLTDVVCLALLQPAFHCQELQQPFYYLNDCTEC
jgi:hypothetical protein